MSKGLREVLTGIALAIIVMSLFGWFVTTHGPEYRNYGGKVIDKGYEQPYEYEGSKGRSYIEDGKYWIVIRDDSTHEALRFNVTVPTYYSKKIGDYAGFRVNDIQLQNYGN